MMINCQCFKYPNKCTHQAAPRRLFGTAKCIEVDKEYDFDPRLGVTCRLKVEHIRPNKPPPPPKAK